VEDRARRAHNPSRARSEGGTLSGDAAAGASAAAASSPSLILLLVVAIAAAMLFAGCTTTEVHSPSGWTYRSTRLFNNAGVDELDVNPATGVITIKGVRSDSSKGLDVALEALRKMPALPISMSGAREIHFDKNPHVMGFSYERSRGAGTDSRAPRPARSENPTSGAAVSATGAQAILPVARGPVGPGHPAVEVSR
jgi:hypothetical protein